MQFLEQGLYTTLLPTSPLAHEILRHDENRLLLGRRQQFECCHLEQQAHPGHYSFNTSVKYLAIDSVSGRT